MELRNSDMRSKATSFVMNPIVCAAVNAMACDDFRQFDTEEEVAAFLAEEDN